jgi:hypothetical protein
MVSSSFWCISFLCNSFFLLSGKTHCIIDARIRGKPSRQFCTSPLFSEEPVGRTRREKCSWIIRSTGIWSHVLCGWYQNWHNVVVYSSRFQAFCLDISTFGDETILLSQNGGFQLPSDAAFYPGGANTCYITAQTAGVVKLYRIDGGDQIWNCIHF